jgi:hypothetical protein
VVQLRIFSIFSLPVCQSQVLTPDSPLSHNNLVLTKLLTISYRTISCNPHLQVGERDKSVSTYSSVRMLLPPFPRKIFRRSWTNCGIGNRIRVRPQQIANQFTISNFFLFNRWICSISVKIGDNPTWTQNTEPPMTEHKGNKLKMLLNKYTLLDHWISAWFRHKNRFPEWFGGICGCSGGLLTTDCEKFKKIKELSVSVP